MGTGGHTSFGGFGLFSRQAGLLLDRVIAADVVLANGTAVTAAQSKYPDLFWVRVLRSVHLIISSIQNCPI